MASRAARPAATCSTNIAVWDITGKELGLPLYRLLGGRARERIRTYANGWHQAERVATRAPWRDSGPVPRFLGYRIAGFEPLGGGSSEDLHAADRCYRTPSISERWRGPKRSVRSTSQVTTEAKYLKLSQSEAPARTADGKAVWALTGRLLLEK